MNRLIDRWGGNGARAFAAAQGYPAVNMWEDQEHVFVQAELPGLNLQELEIYVTGGNTLTLKGSRKPTTPEKGVWHRQERVFGEFERPITLPFVVDPDKVDARFENGVLTVQLAKHESARPRKINVKGE
jgi:HSP20 family protein